MRVLHVTECLAAGTAAAIFSYVKAFPEAEHHLLYALRAESTSLPVDWESMFETHEEFRPGPVPRIQQVRSSVKSLEPDVLHSHSSWGGLYARMAVRKSTSLHQVYTPHCFAFERRDWPGVLTLAIRLMESTLALNTSSFAACSAGEAKLARTLPGSALVVHVPNVSPTLAGSGEHGAGPAARHALAGVKHDGDTTVPHTSLRIVGAGRISPQKDPRYFLAVLEALRENGLDVEAVWVGDGERELVDELVSHGVVVTGWLNAGEYRDVLEHSDVYVHSARWEGFPLTVLEAATAGLPVIVRSIRAFADSGLPMIEHAAEVQGFADRLRDVNGRAVLRKMTERALSNHTKREQRQALAQVYGFVLTQVDATEVEHTR